MKSGHYNDTEPTCGDHLTGICADIYRGDICLRKAEEFQAVYFDSAPQYCEDMSEILYALFIRLNVE